MKLTKTKLLILGSLLSLNAQGFTVKIPGIKIPPPTEWNIGNNPKFNVGGSVGALWEGNKEAITLSTAGSTVFGPLGLIAGLYQGHKGDVARRNAMKTLQRMEKDVETLKAATTKWESEAYGIGNGYVVTSIFLSDRNSPQVAFDELEEAYLAASWCLVSATSKTDAEDCLFDFEDETQRIKRAYR